jgi:hypothetical protein
MIAASVLGREGSISFPGENTYPILGRPVLLFRKLNLGFYSGYLMRILQKNDK